MPTTPTQTWILILHKKFADNTEIVETEKPNVYVKKQTYAETLFLLKHAACTAATNEANSKLNIACNRVLFRQVATPTEYN